MVRTRRTHRNGRHRRPRRGNAGQLHSEACRHSGRTQRTRGDNAEAPANVAPRQAEPPRHIQNRHVHTPCRHDRGVHRRTERQVCARALPARDENREGQDPRPRPPHRLQSHRTAQKRHRRGTRRHGGNSVTER